MSGSGCPPVVFILGSPRSGTTWLQDSLAAHPLIASPPELHLFVDMIDPLLAKWRWRASVATEILDDLRAGRDPRMRLIGLPTLLEESAFDDLLRDMCQRVLETALRLKPTAQVVLEKSPSNSLVVDTLLRCVPNASLLHIVRNPYDVVASMLDIRSSWGSTWAPRDTADAARTWSTHVLGARRARDLAPNAYHEIDYEDLRRQPAQTVDQLSRFLHRVTGVDLSGTTVDAAHAAAGSQVLAPSIRERLGGMPVQEPAPRSAVGSERWSPPSPARRCATSA
jgi:hypothetical protein